MLEKVTLDKFFSEFLQGIMSETDIIAFSDALDVEDIDSLLTHVSQIGEPHDDMVDLDEFVESDNAKSAIIAKGFFEYIDLVAALILVKGEVGIDRALAFTFQGEYGNWVRRYVRDPRFQGDIREQFSFLGI